MNNHNFKLFLKDERGAALTVVVLILIPLLFGAFVMQSEFKRTVIASDNKLQNAVSIATKDSAMMVDHESQAYGNPNIIHEKALERFVLSLQSNLALNGELTGEDHSMFHDLKYWVLVYNGETRESEYNNGLSSYAFYTNQNGIIESVTDNSIVGFPKTLYISDTGISEYSTENSVEVTLTAPGVLSVVQGQSKQVFSDTPKPITRWAYAKITLREIGGENG